MLESFLDEEMWSETLSCGPSLKGQVTMGLIEACFWFIFFAVCIPPIATWTKSRPWCKGMVLIERKKYRNFGFDDSKMTDDVIVHQYCEMSLVAVQHFIGGMLCVPALCGYSSLIGFSALAAVRHGGLCEVSYEWQDTCKQFYRFATDPLFLPATFVFLFFHHFISQSLVLPMNLHYSEDWWYAALVFNLQGASAIALFVSQYLETFNIKKFEDLRAMYWMVNVCGVVMITTRGPIFFVSCFYIMRMLWYNSMAMFCTAGVAVSLMGLFNIFILWDSYTRMVKYAKYLREYKPESEDAAAQLSALSDIASDALSVLNPHVRALPKQDYDLKKYVEQHRSYSKLPKMDPLDDIMSAPVISSRS